MERKHFRMDKAVYKVAEVNGRSNEKVSNL